MRVFVGFGFLPEEAWVEQLAIPLLQQLGLSVVHGKEIAGEIDATIRREIQSCDALVGFLLRRGKRAGRDGSWPTSDYVRQEIEIALAGQKDVIQIVEHGVKAPGGFLQQRQRLDYRSPNRDLLLLSLTRHLREWIDGEVKVRLLPDTLVKALATKVQPRAECRYEIIEGGLTVRDATAEIVPEGGGMFTKLLGFRPGTQAQLRVVVNGVEWTSTFENHASPFTSIELRP